MAASYVPDPATRNTPLQPSEVKPLLDAGGKALRDQRTAQHFLQRVLATIEVQRQEFNRLHRQVATITAERQHQGKPTSLDPRTAAKFLPPEEIDAMASGHLQAKIDAQETALAEVSEVRRQVLTRVNGIKFAVSTLLEDRTLSDEVRTRFITLVNSLPEPEELAASTPPGGTAPVEHVPQNPTDGDTAPDTSGHSGDPENQPDSLDGLFN